MKRHYIVGDLVWGNVTIPRPFQVVYDDSTHPQGCCSETTHCVFTSSSFAEAVARRDALNAAARAEDKS